jgi:lipoyl-dependent peroxiredoxin
VPAKASAEWHGDIRSGAGSFAAGDSISGGVTNRSRFECGPGSNPEQLLGAAHASCFSMELASYLDKFGTPAQRILTNAEVTVRLVKGTPTITKIDLFTVGTVPGLDKVSFEEHAVKAKANCPVGRALSGVLEVTLEAILEPPEP